MTEPKTKQGSPFDAVKALHEQQEVKKQWGRVDTLPAIKAWAPVTDALSALTGFPIEMGTQRISSENHVVMELNLRGRCIATIEAQKLSDLFFSGSRDDFDQLVHETAAQIKASIRRGH